MFIPTGEWRAPGQPPIIVLGSGEQPDGKHGPWIKWKFPWDTSIATTIWYEFEELAIKAGYSPVKTA
jgi:hypothetical protein